VELTGNLDLDTGKSYAIHRKAAVPLGDRILDTSVAPPLPAATHGHRIQPIFSTRKITTNVSILPGHGVLMVSPKVDDENNPVTRRLVVLVTAQTIDPQGGLIDAAAAAAAAAKPGGKIATATPVPNKPGFVTSPYAANAGFCRRTRVPSGNGSEVPLHRQNLPHALKADWRA